MKKRRRPTWSQAESVRGRIDLSPDSDGEVAAGRHEEVAGMFEDDALDGVFVPSQRWRQL